MKVKIKRLHKDAVIPKYAKQGDAGLDLTAVTKTLDADGNVVYGTGLAFEIPQGFVGLVFPRSSNARKDLLLSNSVGVIDSGYRGEVAAKFKRTTAPRYDGGLMCGSEQYKIGDRIAQMIILPYPQIEFEEVGQLSETARGQGGYGSTGN